MPIGPVRVDVVPAKAGLRTDIPRHLVGDDHIVDGLNVICRDGKLLTRPGSTPLTSSAPATNRIMGMLYYKDFALVQRTIAATLTGFKLFNGSTWADITGTTLTGTSSNQVRMAVMPFQNSTRVLAVNDKDATQSYSGSGTFVDLATLGSTNAPIAKSVCVTFQRAILGNVTVTGTRRSSALWISAFQDPTTWVSNNEVNLTDTDDTIVDVRALTNEMFVIYKERSQWVGSGAGGIFPFIFQIRGREPGPCAPNAVVMAESDHYYLGVDGDIYKFDGTRCVSIGGYVKRTIQEDLDWPNQPQVNAFYDEINREIWWFWPTVQSPTKYAGINYRLPYEDVPGAFSTLQVFAQPITASTRWLDHSTATGTWDQLNIFTWNNIANTYPTWDSFSPQGRPANLIADSNGNVYRFGAFGGDNGLPFDAFWITPFKAMGGLGENVQIHKIESFFKQTVNATNVNISLITTDNLDDNGTMQNAQTVDISSGGKLRATYPNILTRFVAVKHELTAATGLQEYRGGILYGYSRGEF